MEGAQAYNEAAIILFGEYARLNDVPITSRKIRNQIEAKLNCHLIHGFFGEPGGRFLWLHSFLKLAMINQR